tara:strand:- start:161 stop:2941 length:2781 start_codon:yes stop_codon:yes gene_type:complete
LRYLLFILLSQTVFSQVPSGEWVASPYPFSESSEITLTVSGINTGNMSGVSEVYLWTWYTKSDGSPTNPDSNWNGQWSNSNDAMKMVNNNDGSFSYTFKPTELYDDTGIERIGVLAKAKDGAGDKKTQDYYIDVGIFSFDLLEPENSYSIIESGANQSIVAETDVNVDFTLYEGINVINEKKSSKNFSYIIKNINENTSYSLKAKDLSSGDEITRSFEVVIKPSVSHIEIPYDSLEDGANYIENGNVVLLFYAPGKEFVHINGSFVDWKKENSYLMNYDPILKRFWYEFDNLDFDKLYSYQYIVDGVISIADPYSELILDSNQDSYLCLTSDCGFDDLPSYPLDNNHAASVLDMDTEFNWDDENYVKPKKEELIIYEVLIRDFDKGKSFKSLYDRLDYIEGLGVNAIELMPVNEFDGNESWGYNPSFHMAIDKAYGSPEELKKLVNECHKRGIAVIIDVVYNHATGQNPYFRLWNTKPNTYDGDPTHENDFFQISPVSEPYLNYFNDINHDFSYVRDYIKRINTYLISEYHIDGFRFDLTKGFTNENIAENYISSRVDYLKMIADDVRGVDEDSYIIFEHFQGFEEKIFSDHGILTWGEENYNYNEATMGYVSDFSGISYKNRGFSNPTLVGFMESHDKERLMYKNLEYGNSSGSYDIKHFDNAMNRMQAAGALFFTVPGPKMIWQFGELGYDISINKCPDGNISEDCRVSNKESAFKLDMDKGIKRAQLYDVWSRILSLRNTENIFHTSDFNMNLSSELKTIKLYSNDPAQEISEVLVIGNFGMKSIQIKSDMLPEGDLYDIYYNNLELDRSRILDNPLQPGKFMIIANGETKLEDDLSLTLSLEGSTNQILNIYPNPTQNILKIVFPSRQRYDLTFYDSNGKLVDNNQFVGATIEKDISNYDKGFYYVLIQSKSNTSYVRILKK